MSFSFGIKHGVLAGIDLEQFIIYPRIHDPLYGDSNRAIGGINLHHSRGAGHGHHPQIVNLEGRRAMLERKLGTQEVKLGNPISD
jgi:hypothetical protein